MLSNAEMNYKLPPAWGEREVALLDTCGEHLAAGFLADEGTPLQRMARGWRRQLEQAHEPGWHGEALYPSGSFSWFRQGSAVSFDYSFSLVADGNELSRRSMPHSANSALYARLKNDLGSYPFTGRVLDPDITLGGSNYTHSILNYGRVLREGLAAYEARIAGYLQQARLHGSQERIGFYQAMQDVVAGIRAAHGRALAYLDSLAPAAEGDRLRLERLRGALARALRQPAASFYDALVATNFLYYLDGCDNLGRFDQDLGGLYEADLAAGKLDESQGERLVSLLWDNINANSGWNVAVGGCDAQGKSAVNRLTVACLRAARHHRRPNLALRVTQDMPEEALDAALDSIASGCGIPALYNDEKYRSAVALAGLGVPPAEYANLAFGGCTELMVHGCSNVGSLDAGLNLPLVLMRTLERCLASAGSFEELLTKVKADLAATVSRMAAQVSQAQELHSRWQPQPLRTLLIDDCLEQGREFNAGGARYNWSVVNVGGLGNVVDSLAAIRELVFNQGYLSGAEYWRALQANYDGYDTLLGRIKRCPRYGNDNPRADDLARDLCSFLFSEMHRYIPWRGGHFLPGCLLFVTYAQAGEAVMATPDGRLAGEAIADSIGAVAGRDRSGPTALIRSVAGIPQELAPGTLVTNFRFAKTMFEGENRARLKELIRSYFSLGGMQMQITVLDQQTLQAALAEPDKYADLIVRVGGYSEYWINLSQVLRQTVLERTEYAN
ncbi:MAG: pyruvate formate lyase family protein [Anaerolineae bacterium]